MPSPDLATLQRWMQTLILHPEDTTVAAATPEARALIPRAAVLAGDILVAKPDRNGLQRLQVYNGGYLSRLVEVLETDYGAVKYVLGGDDWKRLAMACAYAHPSRHPNLNAFGAPLPDFAASQTWLGERRAFVADLAELAWAMTEAFDAPEFEPFDMASLQDVPQERWIGAVLTPNPSVRVLEFDYPANAFMQAWLNDKEPDVPEPGASWCAVYRKDNVVYRLDLPEPMSATLRALCEGESFGVALAAGGEHGEDVGAWFREWSADGLFVGVHLGES